MSVARRRSGNDAGTGASYGRAVSFPWTCGLASGAGPTSFRKVCRQAAGLVPGAPFSKKTGNGNPRKNQPQIEIASLKNAENFEKL